MVNQCARRCAVNTIPVTKTCFGFLSVIVYLFLASGLTSCGAPQKNDAELTSDGDLSVPADGIPLNIVDTASGSLTSTVSFGPTPNDLNCTYCAVPGIGDVLPISQPTRACSAIPNSTCYSVSEIAGNTGRNRTQNSCIRRPGDPVTVVNSINRINLGLAGIILFGRCDGTLEIPNYPGDTVLIKGTNLAQTTALIVGSRKLLPGKDFIVKKIPPSLVHLGAYDTGIFFTIPLDFRHGVYNVYLENKNRVTPYFKRDIGVPPLRIKVSENIRIDSVTPLQSPVGSIISLRGTGGLNVAAPNNIVSSDDLQVFFGITEQDPIGQLSTVSDAISNQEVQVEVPFGAKPGKIKIRVGCNESISRETFTPLSARPPTNLRAVRVTENIARSISDTVRERTFSPRLNAAVGDWVSLTGDGLLSCLNSQPIPEVGNIVAYNTFFNNRSNGHICGDQVVTTDRYPLSYIKASRELNLLFPPTSETKVFFTGRDGWVEGSLRFADPTIDSSNVIPARSPSEEPRGLRRIQLSFISAQVPSSAISGPIKLVTACGSTQTSRSLTITSRSQSVTTTPAPLTRPSSSQVVACGGAISCYDNADAMRSGRAKLPSGVDITLVPGAGSFNAWKEKNGLRILAASGLEADGWQKKLGRNGREFSQEDFTNISVLAGRICLGHVYNFANNGFANPKCVYYSKESDSPITFWQPGQNAGIEGEDYFGEWRESSWYHGNISQCNSLGMRLPIIREMNANIDSSGRPKERIYESPKLFGTGIPVPANKFILTATVFDPPSNTNLDGVQCSPSDFNNRLNFSCSKGQYPDVFQFTESFATSARARSMYWVAVNTSAEKRLTRSSRSFPMFYFPGQNGEVVAPVHALCVLPSSN